MQCRRRRVARVSGAAAALVGIICCWPTSCCPGLWWFAERGQYPALDGLPKVTRNADGIPGDPINVGLVGTKAELIGAMLAAGWRPADPITLRSSLEIAASVVLDRPDPDAPVSPLYLFGRKQDLAFEQEVGRSADRRHHVRWWLTDQTEAGRPFWLGDASFDVDSGVSHLTGQITHHIAPDIDADARPADGRSRRGRRAGAAVPAPGRRPDPGRPQRRRRPLLHRWHDRCGRARSG